MGKAEPNEKTQKKDNGKSASDALAKIEKLFARATDDAASVEEARTCALKCVQLMKENELAVVPKEELDAVKKNVDEMKGTIVKLKKEASGAALKWGLIGAAASKFLKV